MINQFSKETIEGIGYYVYRLIDPRNGQTFYVGKGKGNRVFEHVKGSVKYYEGVEDASDTDPNKLRIIKEIMGERLEVIHIIQRWNLTEKEAYEVEAALIDAYQGLSNVQSGHHTEFGVTNADLLERRFRLQEYEEPSDFHYIIIKVKDWKLEEMLKKYPQTNRYEATRAAWKISPKSVTEYPYVFSVTDGIVKEVYKINNWYKSERPGRYEFNGEIAHEEIRTRFREKRIPSTYIQKGMANPVLFSKNKTQY